MAKVSISNPAPSGNMPAVLSGGFNFYTPFSSPSGGGSTSMIVPSLRVVIFDQGDTTKTFGPLGTVLTFVDAYSGTWELAKPAELVAGNRYTVVATIEYGGVYIGTNTSVVTNVLE